MDIQRRRFLRYAAAGGVACALGHTPGTVWAQVAGSGGFSDYKALVCLFLFGGNDSWNMFVPTGSAEYSAYARSRGAGTASSLALDAASLLPVAGAPYGFHPAMTGVRGLFDTGRAAVLANVGPLVRPTTKAQYQTPGHELPPQLFSHNDQQAQWHSLRGRAVLRSGWAGRVADILAGDTAGQQLALNVSLSGQTFFQAGEQATPYVMGATGPAAFLGHGDTGTALSRRQAFEAIVAAGDPTVYGRSFAAVQGRALQFAGRVNAALAGAHAFEALPDGTGLSSLATQLRTVAKMISARDTLGMSRQVFFVSTGGFDTHDNQNDDQPGLLANVSDAVSRFDAALREIGMDGSVTLFTHSDFGRTLTSNGDGSDHAWGGVQLIVGGAVRGGTVYGDYPLLEIGSELDVGGGRFIPTTSADQYAATLARWFGVPDGRLAEVAPHLANFPVRDLGFLG